MVPGSAILAASNMRFNSPDGFVRATGQVFERLGVFTWLLDGLRDGEGRDAVTLITLARECIDLDSTKRPQHHDVRYRLVTDVSVPRRSTCYHILQMVADSLFQAAEASPDFTYRYAAQLVIGMDAAVYYLRISPEELAAAFVAYYRSLPRL